MICLSFLLYYHGTFLGCIFHVYTILHIHCLCTFLLLFSLDIFVRFQQTEYTVREDDEFVYVYFEAVREVSPGSGIYVVANYTFDFELLVKTVNGLATSECMCVGVAGFVCIRI